jgi:hypothetical protein
MALIASAVVLDSITWCPLALKIFRKQARLFTDGSTIKIFAPAAASIFPGSGSNGFQAEPEAVTPRKLVGSNSIGRAALCLSIDLSVKLLEKICVNRTASPAFAY